MVQENQIMYGLILESIADCIRRKYGNETWNRIRTKAGITHLNFGRQLRIRFITDIFQEPLKS